MIGGIAKKFFGSANERYITRLEKIIDAVNAAEPDVEKLSDDDLRARTDMLKKRLADGESLDDILVDAFATVREAAKRTLGERHFDVQIMGGIILHRGMIAEMKTGEGKTLVSTLPVYLNALSGNGVHVVTVNDYLAQRDGEWMGQIYRFLGLSVGCITHSLDDQGRREAYACDITYGTNNEFGFDYLRDNMKFSLDEMVQRDFSFAIIDEVDSILIDEARTPLIISGPTEDSSELYMAVDKIIPSLKDVEDYEKDEKQRTVALTDAGNEHVEQLLKEHALVAEEDNLYDLQNISLVHHVNQALRAHVLFSRDKDYVIKDGRVIIIDEFTGRMMEGRRYSDGLHQALEAKEHVNIQMENQTLASITFQNYFRLYPKLAGMTGTAMTEAGEFASIYKLDVVEIPTNMPMIRDDQDDEVYRTGQERDEAVIDLIETAHKRGQPVLVGTVSIEKSEELSEKLKKRKLNHYVLNARYHEQEAFIIAQAGALGGITIATNMAGRGTDIKLGGNAEMRVAQELGETQDDPGFADKVANIEREVEEAKRKVLEAGGLFVIGTERHESRRIDNQLRGRSGRQGDPGASKFFISLQDDLMRIFGSERMDSWLQRLGLREGEAIIHSWINKALEKAQRKVEERNFEIRKNLLRFDDVMNDQRKVIYEQRKELMQTVDVSETVTEMRQEVVEETVQTYVPEGAYPEQWDVEGLHTRVLSIFGLDLPIREWAAEEGIADRELTERIAGEVDKLFARKSAKYGAVVMRMAEKSILLQILDQQWKDHLLSLDHLRQAINLRAYGQKDPLIEYKREAFNLFSQMLGQIRETVVGAIAHMEIEFKDDREQPLPPPEAPEMHESRVDPAFAAAPAEDGDYGMALATAEAEAPEGSAQTVRTRAAADVVDPGNPETWGRVSRNAACPCGSGRKYKHCHGKMH